MPGSDMTRASVPIPINYTKSCYSFSDSGKPKKRYLFDLVLTLKNRQTKKFTKLEKNLKSTIIDIEDNINYDEISDFVLNFAEIPFDNDNEYTIQGKINHSFSSFHLNSDKFYIEFSQNYSGKTICQSYILDGNLDYILSISPN
tara:strand:- start:1210 stop:1641 length:432 start_codon:yes stop_codon:yes gene_type:complete